MLTAISTRTGELVLATQVSREHSCRCPECEETLVYKQGPVVVSHFAHHARTACSLSEGESVRHMQMKIQMGQWFTTGGRAVEYEKRILSYRRADLVVNEKAVIECQASPVSIREIEARTQDYNDHGLPVMWVWDAVRLFGKTIRAFPPAWLAADNEPWESQPEYRIPAEIRHLHDHSGERIFLLDATGELRVVRLRQAAERSSEWFDEDGEERSNEYTPKTLKRISSYQFEPHERLVPYRARGGLRYVIPHFVADSELVPLGRFNTAPGREAITRGRA